MPDGFWGERTFAAALAVFGPSVYNVTSRTYLALDRRITHTMAVWTEKYGPLTPEQERYADEVLGAVILRAEKDAAGDRQKLWPYAQSGIGRAVHHERVVAGMRKRGGYVSADTILAQLA